MQLQRRSRVHVALARTFGAAAILLTVSCIHPGLLPNGRPMIWLTGEVREWPDSTPAAAALVAILGGPNPGGVGVLAQTLTWRDGRFALQLGSNTPIDCTTLRVRVAKIGHVTGESRPGQLRCTRDCQWVDLRLTRPGPVLDIIDVFDVSPVSCTWTDGYPGPKRPA
jgi:hypothetical protein